MRIQFFPSDHGGGFGHISRCLALADEAKRRGHDCNFILSEHKYEARIGMNYPVKCIKSFDSLLSRFIASVGKRAKKKTDAAPLYIGLSGLDYQVIRDGLVSAEAVSAILAEYRKAIEVFKPDLLIGDTNLLLWILARNLNLPLVQIVRYASHPATAKLIWWQQRPEGMVAPDSAALFNPILGKALLNPIRKAEDLLQGDLYLVPSIEELEPIPKDGKTEYVGELAIRTKEAESLNLDTPDNKKPLIYITIGGGAGSVGNRMFFSEMIRAFANKSLTVIVSTGQKFRSDTFSNHPANIHFFDWVPGRAMIEKSDIVLFHGGYGTMMEILAAGKPSIILPFHTEQEGNGRRLGQLGCGRVVPLSQQEFLRVDRKWKFGNYSYLVQNRFDLKAEDLAEEVKQILGGGEYAANARKIQKKLQQYGGTMKAMAIIEKKFQ